MDTIMTATDTAGTQWRLIASRGIQVQRYDGTQWHTVAADIIADDLLSPDRYDDEPRPRHMFKTCFDVLNQTIARLNDEGVREATLHRGLGHRRITPYTGP